VELLDVVRILGELGGNHDLVLGNHRLGVVALDGAVAGVQEAAVGVGGVGGRVGVEGLLRPALELAGLAALGQCGRGVGGNALPVGLLPRGGLGLQLRLGLAQPRQPVGLAGQCGRQLVAAGVTEQPILALVGLGGLPEDLGDLGLKLGVGAVGLVGGVAGQLGAIQRDRADLDHASGSAQLQRGDQEAGQRLLVAGAEPGDGDVVGGLVGGQDAEGDVLLAAAFDLAGGAHPQAVAIQQHAEQGLGVVGGVAVPVVAVLPVERVEVELVCDVEDEPGEVALGEPVAQVRGQEEGLVAVAAQEGIGHGLFYMFTVLAPNAPGS
jgi:hypothetical protein